MYGEQTKKRILEMYEPCNRVVAEASRKLSHDGINISPGGVAGVWKRAGYVLNKRGGRRTNTNPIISKKDRDYIISAYYRYCGSPSLARKSMRYSPETIARIWREAGLEIKSTTLVAGGLESIL